MNSKERLLVEAQAPGRAPETKRGTMGVLLSKPNTDKTYDEGENARFAFAACSMQVRLSARHMLGDGPFAS